MSKRSINECGKHLVQQFVNVRAKKYKMKMKIKGKESLIIETRQGRQFASLTLLTSQNEAYRVNNE